MPLRAFTFLSKKLLKNTVPLRENLFLIQKLSRNHRAARAFTIISPKISEKHLVSTGIFSVVRGSLRSQLGGCCLFATQHLHEAALCALEAITEAATCERLSHRSEAAYQTVNFGFRNLLATARVARKSSFLSPCDGQFPMGNLELSHCATSRTSGMWRKHYTHMLTCHLKEIRALLKTVWTI